MFGFLFGWDKKINTARGRNGEKKNKNKQTHHRRRRAARSPPRTYCTRRLGRRRSPAARGGSAWWRRRRWCLGFFVDERQGGVFFGLGTLERASPSVFSLKNTQTLRSAELHARRRQQGQEEQGADSPCSRAGRVFCAVDFRRRALLPRCV